MGVARTAEVVVQCGQVPYARVEEEGIILERNKETKKKSGASIFTLSFIFFLGESE